MSDHSPKDIDNARCYIDLALHCAHCGPESAGPTPDDQHACATCYGPLVLTDERGATVLREMLGREMYGRGTIEAVCPDCGPSVACDEDLCCATCGRDVILCADRYATEVLGEVLGEVLAEAEARGYQRGIATVRAAHAEAAEARPWHRHCDNYTEGYHDALGVIEGALDRLTPIADTSNNPPEPNPTEAP